MTQKTKSFFSFFGLGEYPPEYNPRVHGPYDPSRNYGKRKFFILLLVKSLATTRSRRCDHANQSVVGPCEQDAYFRPSVFRLKKLNKWNFNDIGLVLNISKQKTCSVTAKGTEP